MAALSVVICDRSAKIIFARQFFNISRMDLEEYIIQFSRGVDSCKEITHFESDKVRYLFIPIDTFYLILITTKNSNIIEDTEILKLIEEKEFKRKKEEQELAVQKALEEKGREFDRQRREKKFNSNAISSSSFVFKEENIEKESNDSNENKTLNLSKKKKEEEEEIDKVEEVEEEEKKIVKPKKKGKGGLKLSKKKNYN